MAPPLMIPGPMGDRVGSAAEREALVALYAATDGPNWTRRDNWLSNSRWTSGTGRLRTKRGSRLVDCGTTDCIPFSFLDLSELRVLDPLVSISLTGGDASVRLDGASNAPMTIMRDPVTGQIRAILREPETTAMWAFALAEAQRFEVFFSRGIPDMEEQRR